MKQITIIINGKGASGKDTFCEILGNHYKVVNRSSITPIKEIASIYGGWEGGKEPRDRKFLSDLKALFTEYNDLPNVYCVNEYRKFKTSENEILFIHIREPENIEKFVNSVNGDCVTLLIRGGMANENEYGNRSDDEVENYDYDFCFFNAPITDTALTKDEISARVEENMLEFFEFMKNEVLKRELPHDFN